MFERSLLEDDDIRTAILELDEDEDDHLPAIPSTVGPVCELGRISVFFGGDIF